MTIKTFAQTAILVAGLAGLSACASTGAQNSQPVGDRTAGSKVFAGQVYDNAGDALAACQERVRRLEDLNRACYRK